MKAYKNMRISAKLLTGFIIVSVIAAVVGIVGIFGMKKIYSSTEIIINQRLIGIKELATIKEAQNAVLAGERFLVNTNLLDAEIRQANYTFVEEGMQRAEDAIKIYEQLSQSREEEKAWKQFTLMWSQWKEEHQQVMDQEKEKDKLIEAGVSITDVKITDISKESLERCLNARDTYITASNELNKLIDYYNKAADNDAEYAKQLNQRLGIVLITTIIIGVILAILLGVIISRIITKPIKLLTNSADKLALGDVNINLVSESKDEIGMLTEAFIKMIANIKEQAFVVERIASGDLTCRINVKSKEDLLGIKLEELLHMNNEALGKIHKAAEQVAVGAKQMADTSIGLSEGASEQASSVEELTASIEEISSQTQQNAENANQANTLAETTRTNAISGNNKMVEMLSAMQEINDSSSSISKIIKVIDEIAFQTNILALNAAVEAARAGQHGKGFAVVAEEVRNLAARSANAAKETTDMIEGLIKKVDYGTKIANETAQALSKMVEDIAKVAILVDNIAIASNEQSSGLTQINQGIMQVSEVVQTNSATAQESAAVSEELSGQAELLKAQVGQFKLKEEAFSDKTNIKTRETLDLPKNDINRRERHRIINLGDD